MEEISADVAYAVQIGNSLITSLGSQQSSVVKSAPSSLRSCSRFVESLNLHPSLMVVPPAVLSSDEIREVTQSIGPPPHRMQVESKHREAESKEPMVHTAARMNIEERGVTQCIRSTPLRLQDVSKHRKSECVDSIHFVGLSPQRSGKLSGKLVIVEEMVENKEDDGMSRNGVDHEGEDGVEDVSGVEMLDGVGEAAIGDDVKVGDRVVGRVVAMWRWIRLG